MEVLLLEELMLHIDLLLDLFDVSGPQVIKGLMNGKSSPVVLCEHIEKEYN